MKLLKTTLILGALVLGLTLNALDRILLKSGEEISGWIFEKSDTEIKYKIISSEHFLPAV